MKKFFVFKGGKGLYEEKKSRFISEIFPVADDEQATEIIEKTKKKYWDARHNCYAYIIGSNGESTRCNDDGEPSGTAGRPMLEVLEREDVYNCLVVVTRYFGGTLLGTGGLVRAYTNAVKYALEDSQILEKIDGYECVVNIEYNNIGKIQHVAEQMNITVTDTEYTEKVAMRVALPLDYKDQFIKKVTQVTSGKVRFDGLENKLVFALSDEGVIYL